MKQTPKFPSLFYKQRLSAAGIFLLGGVLLYLLFPKFYAFLLIPLALAFLLGSLFRSGEGRKTFLCFALGISLAICSVSLLEIRKTYLDKLCKTEGIAQGYVLSSGEEEFDLKLSSFDEKRCSYRVRCQGEAPPQGSRVRVKISVLESFPSSARSEGIDLLAETVGEYTLCGENAFFRFVGTVRERILGAFGKGEIPSFLSAILLGERTHLTKSVKDAFRITASSHILAISGLHVTQLIGFFFLFSRVFSFDIRLTRVLIYPLVFFLYFLAGAGISVFRACFMTLFAVTGLLLRRRSDSVTALIFSGALLVFFDPFTLENMSFLFSYFSTFALVTCGVPLAEKTEEYFTGNGKEKCFFNKCAFAVCASLCISLAVFVFMLPLQLFFFGEVQIFSPLYALILVPLFQPVLIVALFLALLSFLPGPYSFLSPVLIKVSGLYLDLVKVLAAASPGLVSLGNLAMPIAIFIAGVLIFFFYRKVPLTRILYFHLALFLLLVLCPFFGV